MNVYTVILDGYTREKAEVLLFPGGYPYLSLDKYKDRVRLDSWHSRFPVRLDADLMEILFNLVQKEQTDANS